MLVNRNINNLSGGVSQQPDEMRYDNQVDSMDNFTVTVAEGLRRRNPLDVVNTVSTGSFSDNMAIHSYDRGDGQEKYGMIFDNNGLRVFDGLGVEKTVTVTGINPLTQWGTGTGWKSNLQFLTIGDTTWVLNKEQTVGYTSPDDYVNENRAYYWIKKTTSVTYGSENASFKGYNYEIVLNGTSYSAYTISGQDTTDSIAVIEDLAAAINGDVIGGVTFTAQAKGSILYITGNGTFTFASGDSFGNQASAGWMDSVSKVADLPSDMSEFTEAEVGVIAITGTDRDSFTNYYLKWTGSSWAETYRPDTQIILTPETMPAKLARQANGTFTFGFNIINEAYDGFEYTWDDRVKGDEDSNPKPSFIGSQISNMFFFKNRLGFTSGENVILSEAAEYYNFFATTAMEVIDSDPIDASVDSNTVSVIRNVNATAGALTLWADDAQFLLAGGEILSPATTRISQTSSYACDNSISPIVLDNEILFFNKGTDYLEVKTYAPASLQSDKSSAESISSHIPKYLPSTIDSVVSSSADNMVFMLDSEDRSKIYVYKYHVHGGKKVISAWFKWSFNESIRAINVLANTLFVLINSNQICTISLEPKDIDGTFLDKGTDTYESTVVLSEFNIPTKQNSKNFKDKLFLKNLVVNREGYVVLDIINSERNSTKSIGNGFLDRKQYLSGSSDKVKIGFSTDSNTGCQINAINIEGRIEPKSNNI